MTRVRGFTQDDAHIFCTEDQVKDEIMGCLELVKIVLGTLGMDDYRVRVGLRDKDSSKYVGDAEKVGQGPSRPLREAASTLGTDFAEEPGEAAFYGTKDRLRRKRCHRDASGSLGTVQVDYNLPEAIWTGVYRFGQCAPSPRNDPPSSFWLDGEIRRRAD